MSSTYSVGIVQSCQTQKRVFLQRSRSKGEATVAEAAAASLVRFTRVALLFYCGCSLQCSRSQLISHVMLDDSNYCTNIGRLLKIIGICALKYTLTSELMQTWGRVDCIYSYIAQNRTHLIFKNKWMKQRHETVLRNILRCVTRCKNTKMPLIFCFFFCEHVAKFVPK